VIEKIFLRSKTAMDASLLIQQTRLTPLISIILRYSAVSVAYHKYSANSGEPFAISTKIIRKRSAALGKNKSVGPDGVYGEILKMDGEAIIISFLFIWFVRLSALRPLLAYCASLG
jgi:hypothetical protein